MTKKKPKLRDKQLRLTQLEKDTLMLDIRAKKGIKFCRKKYKISARTYYLYADKVKKEDDDPTLLDTIQELQLNTVNGWRMRVLQSLMRDEAALMQDSDTSLRQRIAVRQSILATLENTAHSIALTDFQSNIGSEGSVVPPELFDALIESIPEEKRGAFIDELKNHTTAREAASREETANR